MSVGLKNWMRWTREHAHFVLRLRPCGPTLKDERILIVPSLSVRPERRPIGPKSKDEFIKTVFTT